MQHLKKKLSQNQAIRLLLQSVQAYLLQQTPKHSIALKSHSIALISHSIALESHTIAYNLIESHSSYHTIANNSIFTRFQMILFDKINVYMTDLWLTLASYYFTSKCEELFFVWRHFCSNLIAYHSIA